MLRPLRSAGEFSFMPGKLRLATSPAFGSFLSGVAVVKGRRRWMIIQ